MLSSTDVLSKIDIIRTELNDIYCKGSYANTYVVRNEIRNRIELILNDCIVVCDETNNTPTVVMHNCLLVKIMFTTKYDIVQTKTIILGTDEQILELVKTSFDVFEQLYHC